MSNALSNLGALPLSNVSPKDLATRYKSSSFTKRLQLVTKGKLVDQGLVKPGHWVIPVSEEEVTDLGESADVLVLAVRDKALDTNDKPPVASFAPESALFKDIVTRAGTKDSGCMFGPSFLVYERTTGQFLELFFGNASGRQEAGNLYNFLPISKEQAKAYGKGFQEQGPQASTLKSKYIKKPRYAWHAPVVGKCSTPFKDLPESQEFVDQITKFLNQKEDGPEVDDTEGRD